MRARNLGPCVALALLVGAKSTDFKTPHRSERDMILLNRLG
jgi:hypothetical protein